jgi:hypothetical protein
MKDVLSWSNCRIFYLLNCQYHIYNIFKGSVFKDELKMI